jgi:hypothetical protein
MSSIERYALAIVRRVVESRRMGLLRSQNPAAR